jgi:hypothetical protein
MEKEARMKWVALALTGALTALAPVASAYVRTTTRSSDPPCGGDQAKPLYWHAIRIPYVVDAAGSADIADGSVFDAVRLSFLTWEDVACSYISFRYDGTLPNAPIGFLPEGANRNVVKWIESGWTRSRSAIAVTLTTFDCNTGQIFDADITLNGENFTFATTGAPLRTDVQNTVTHEAGHFIGFDHNPDPESTMHNTAPVGETRKRDLTEDDIRGVCDVYPVGKEPKMGGCAAAGGGAGLAAALAVAALLALCRRARRA